MTKNILKYKYTFYRCISTEDGEEHITTNGGKEPLLAPLRPPSKSERITITRPCFVVVQLLITQKTPPSKISSNPSFLYCSDRTDNDNNENLPIPKCLFVLDSVFDFVKFISFGIFLFEISGE